MLKSVEKNILDFQCKLQEISSTSDSDSHHYEPYNSWEATWIEVESNKDALNICPACCKLVEESFPLIGCESPSGRHYLVHSNCTNDINQFIEYSHTAKIITSRKFFTKAPQCRIGCSEYLVQLTFEHPLSPKKFFSFFEKMLESEKKLYYFFNEKTEYSLKPNCIILPTKEFKCSLKLIPLFPTEETKLQTIYFRIDLRKEKEGSQIIKFQENGIIFFCEFEIIENQEKREKLVEEMDFKYERPYRQESFVKFNKFLIELPSEYSLLNPEMNIEEKSFFPIHEFEEKESEESFPSSIVYESPLEKEVEFCDFEFLRTIKTQNCSKEFQRKVKDMKYEEIEKVVNQILPNLEEIILNDYANYMFQSLLGVCTFEQRMKILIKVSVKLTRLVCQQQGTFVLQQLIAFLTTKEEFECICQNSFLNFKIISMDNYGNHFMRKLLQKMPEEMIVLVIPQACENFSELSKNKNAVCVMKCILKVLYENEASSIEMAQQMKRVLDVLTLHTQQLINDEFGNYLIQEAFDLFGESRLSGISEFILNFFVDSSCSKFSNNVVMSCIKKHWRNNPNIFLTLKQKLDHKKIVSMYRQKEGNKILLEILELPVELGVKDKINGALRNEEPSQYNSRHWVSLMNKSKTGAVGTNHYTSFSEAYSFQKRKHYN